MRFVLTTVLAAMPFTLAEAASPTTQPTAVVAARSERPAAPDMVLLYYCFDSNGPRNYTADMLKHYIARHENRGTDRERPTDTFFDTVLWMYRRSSRGALFEASGSTKPTTRRDWEECLDRLYAEDLQLNALEKATATAEQQMGRPIKVNVILTLPYTDVRVSDWGESIPGPTWDFRTSDEPRVEAAKWYIDTAVARWRRAEFKHLRLLGFYWFNESHMNMRPASASAADRNDVSLMRKVARHLHGLEVDGRQMTLTWIPYSPYAKERLSVVADLLRRGEPGDPLDYLMVQPNYFFPRHKKSREDLVSRVRSIASVPCGVEVECDESLVTDESARQRLRDYLDVISAEFKDQAKFPAGYYQGVRTVYEMATRPELADLYERLYRFVADRRQTIAKAP